MHEERFIGVLRALAEATPEPGLWIGDNGRILCANLAAARLMGLHAEELAGKDLFDVFPGLGPPMFAKIRQANGPVRFVAAVQAANEPPRHLELNCQGVSTGENHVIYCQLDAVEVRPGDSVSPPLKASFLQLAGLSADGVIIVQRERIAFANPAALALFRAMRPPDLLNRPVADFFPPALKPEPQTTGNAEAQPGTAKVQVCNLIAADGASLRVECRELPLPHQNPPASLMLLRELTENAAEFVDPPSERREAPHRTALIEKIATLEKIIKTLRQSEEKLRKIFDYSNDAILLIDPENDRIVDANPGACRMLGFPHEELLSLPVSAIHPNEMPQLLAFARSVFQKGAGWTNELSCFTKYGSLLPAEISASIIEMHGRPHLLAMVRDITERRRTEADLRRSEAQIRLLLNSTGEAIYGVDTQGHCTFCNAACLRLLHYDTEAALLGKKMHALIHHSRPEGTPLREQDCPIQCAIARGEGAHAEDAYFWRADGRTFPVEYWLHPVRQDDRIVGYVMTFVDITARKQAEARLKEAKETAEAANQAKNEFLASMSHELRTPLNAILGYAQILLKDASLSGTRREGLAVIQQSGEHLLTLINDALDLARIEAGKLEITKETFHLRHFLKNIESMTRLRAEQKGLSFIYEELSPLPDCVCGDERRLRQVLLNFLSNAIKFTEQGEITLRVGYQEISKGEKKMRIQVDDSGIGIAADHLEEIFLPFQQVGGRRQAREGVGLGLSISRKLVELMSGELHVRSAPATGSSFWLLLDLPAVESAENQPAEEQKTIIGYEGRRRKLLIIDRDPETRSILRHFLAPLDFHVEASARVRSAQLNDPKLDLVLVDFSMLPDAGVRRVRQRRPGASAEKPVVLAMSASLLGSSRLPDIDTGASGFLAKPVREEVLLEKIRRLLGLEWIYAEAEKQPIPANASAAQTESEKIEATLLQPPQKTVRKLHNLAALGDVQGMLDFLNVLQKENAALAPFISHVRALAIAYDMDGICAYLDEVLHIQEGGRAP